jgi:hypothetical protein
VGDEDGVDNHGCSPDSLRKLGSVSPFRAILAAWVGVTPVPQTTLVPHPALFASNTLVPQTTLLAVTRLTALVAAFVDGRGRERLRRHIIVIERRQAVGTKCPNDWAICFLSHILHFTAPRIIAETTCPIARNARCGPMI